MGSVTSRTDIGRLILESVCGQPSVKTASDRFAKDEARKVSNGLSKIASYEYNPDVYRSVQEVMKIASVQIDKAVRAVEECESRISELEKAAEIQSIIDTMIDRGLIDIADSHEKIADLASKDLKQLDIIKEAMSFVRGSKSGNIFFEEKCAEEKSPRKRGMFDGVL